MVTSKGAGRTSRRAAWISALLVGLATVTFAATPVWAGKIHGKLRGVVDVPGASLTLPLPPGSPNVIVTLFLGGPSGSPVPITITPSTKVDAEDSKEKGAGGSISLVDGDSIGVKAKAQQVGATMELVATKIELKNPEIETFGAVDVPGASLALPLPPGSPAQTFTLFIGGIGGPPISIVVTPTTRVRADGLTLNDNDFTEVKAVIQNGQIVALKIRKENQEEVEDE